MPKSIPSTFLIALGIWLYGDHVAAENSAPITGDGTEYLVIPGLTGKSGGSLVTSRRSEPKTLNPLISIDATSKELIGLLNADLIHINRYTHKTEPALASSWRVSPDGRTYTVQLRRGVRFSDGQPFSAEDVLFSFQAYLDAKIHSPQRDLLTIDGAPITVRKIDSHTVVFTLPKPYAAAERLFDSIAMLPKHLLEKAYLEGRLADAWKVSAPPSTFAGLGPFCLGEYRPGESIVLHKNEFYWRKDERGNRLPYLEKIISITQTTTEAAELAFRSGKIDLISRFDPQDFSTLANKASSYRLYDAGPGLEYTFLLFNLNDVAQPHGASDKLPNEQRWFRATAFRQAISLAADRNAMVHLGYSGHAFPLSVEISPGNREWLNTSIPPPVRSIARARDFLRNAGFSWANSGSLRDPNGTPVEFSILHNSGRPQDARIAAILQQDLEELGIRANPVPMDFATLVDRVFNSLSYEVAIMTLADGDTDPNTEMNVLLSKGQTHLWRLQATTPAVDWQDQVDSLMREQMTTLDHTRRKQIFDHIQEIICREQPVVFLLSPNVLVGANKRVQNFRPAVLSSYTLWNADELSLSTQDPVVSYP